MGSVTSTHRPGGEGLFEYCREQEGFGEGGMKAEMKDLGTD